MKTPRVVIGGTQGGLGKTSAAIDIIGALVKKRRRAQRFKIRPDFLDTSFHTVVPDDLK